MVVIDASIAAKWYLLESGRDAARALLLSGEPLLAPDFIVAEVTNVLWKNVRLGKIGASQFVSAFDPLIAAFTRLEQAAPLARQAAEIALALDHPAYDCFYIALAEREGVDLIIADDRLYRKTRRTRFSRMVRRLA